MAKTSNLYVRIEPDIKQQAEAVLSTLGIPASAAVNMFYKQIILQKGMPFDLKIPQNAINDVTMMSSAEMNVELDNGYQDMLSGKVKPAKAAFDSIRGDYNL